MEDQTIISNRYIAHVHISNFQDHKETDIDFTPGINIVTGSSDSGKSAILRAINWVFNNKPQGNSFVRLGTEEATVSVTFSDGIKVTRFKNIKTKNGYTIEYADGQVKTFEKFGTEIPQQVVDALGSPPIDQGNKPISYAEQEGDLFLVSLGENDLPRSISKLTGIHEFEVAAKKIKLKHSQLDRQEKEINQRTITIETDLIEYEGLDNKISDNELLEQSYENMLTRIRGINKAKDMSSEFLNTQALGRQIIKEKRYYEGIVQYEAEVEETVEMAKVIIKQRSLKEQYEQAAKSLEMETKNLIPLKKIYNEENVTVLEEIEVLGTGLIKMLNIMEQHHAYTDQMQEIIKTQIEREKELTGLTKELDQLSKEMVDKGYRCPKCDSILIKGVKDPCLV